MILGFDTATDDTSVAVMDAGRVCREVCIGPSAADGRPQHATALLPAIEDAVDSVGGWEKIDRIGVGCGPGSFTGLRIGLATARALALGREIPVSGVSTLAAIGAAILERGDARCALALIDARRGEVFTALYDQDGGEIWEPMVVGPAELGARINGLGDRVVAAGSGSVRFRDEFHGFPGIVIPDDADPINRVSAAHVCRLCDGVTAVDRHPPEPIYLRAPDAERWLERNNPNPGQTSS